MSLNKFYDEVGNKLPLVPYFPDADSKRQLLDIYTEHFEEVTSGRDDIPATGLYVGASRVNVKDRLKHAHKAAPHHISHFSALAGPRLRELRSLHQVRQEDAVSSDYDPNERIIRFMGMPDIPSYEVFARSRVGEHDLVNTELAERAFRRIAEEFDHSYEVESDRPRVRVKVPRVVETNYGDFAITAVKADRLRLRGRSEVVELKSRQVGDCAIAD